MAKGAYVGVQGITPDLRPSIQSAIENERANRQEKFQREQYEYQKQQNEKTYQQRERELDIKERDIAATAQANGVRAETQRMQTWYNEFGELCRKAQSDLSGHPAFSQYLAETFDELANLREAAIYANTLDAVKYKAQAEKLYQSVLQVSTMAKDYSVLIPNEFTAETVFTTDKIGDLGIMDYLNQYTNKDFKCETDSAGNKYVTNGAVKFGHSADGNFVISLKDETFSSAEAARQRIDSFIVKPDHAGLKLFNTNLDKIEPSKKIYVDSSKGKTERNDKDAFAKSLTSYLDKSFLGAYDDSYTWEQAIAAKDTQLIAAFQQYGMKDNDDNVGQLKRSIVNSKLDTMDMSETVIEAPQKTPTPLQKNINYSNSTNVHAEINRLSNSDNPNDRDAAARMRNIYATGSAINDFITKGDTSGLEAMGYVAGFSNGKFTIASTNKSGISVLIDPKNPISIEQGVNSILVDKYGKDAITWSSDVNTMFDFDGHAMHADALRKFGQSFNKQEKSTDNINGIKNAIVSYLPDNYKVEIKDGYFNGATIVISDADGKNAVEYKFNTNEDVNGDKHISKVIEKIIKAYPMNAKSIFRSTQSSYQPSDNPSGFGNTGNADSNDY